MMAEDIFYKSDDGLTLYARAYGDLSAPLKVLCMHGLTRNHKDFEPMIAQLNDQHCYISVDVRGRGRSERSEDSSRYTPVQYADDMIALLDHLSLDRVALIGTSMGGLMSMLMMKKIPDRIAGVVLNDVGPVPDPSGLARILEYVTKSPVYDDWTAAIEAIAETQGVALRNYTFSDWEAFARRTCVQRDDGMVVPDYDPRIRDAFAIKSPGWLTKLVLWRLFGKLKSRPLLILRGEHSDILSAKMADRMQRRHPRSQLVTIPDRGHAPMLDEPVATVALATFLGSLLET